MVKCIKCEISFFVDGSVATRTKYCPKCRAAKKSERRKLRYQGDVLEYQMSRAAYNTSVGGDYHIAHDPDQSWGKDSSFTLDEIERMLVAGFLTIGTEFSLSPSKIPTHRVVSQKGNLALMAIVNIQPQVVSKPHVYQKRPKPYFRRFKGVSKCPSTIV
jgi:hypothetical protein